jgi:hypothetical protein
MRATGTTRRAVLASASAAALPAGARAASATASSDPFGHGVNLQPGYYCEGEVAVDWSLLAAQSAVETVRIEVEPPGMGATEADLSTVKGWIDAASDRGYTVVATYHHHPQIGSADPGTLQNAADWWVAHYDYLTRDSPVVINLMNEWGDHTVSADLYARAYDIALDTVRSGTDYDGPIVCDLPGYGQGVDRAVRAVGDLDDENLVLSTHLYPQAYDAGRERVLRPGDLDRLAETDYPCVVGEFGDRGEGRADWSALVDRARELGWPLLAWAWNGDGGALNMVDPDWSEHCEGARRTNDYFDTVYPKLTGEGGSDDGDSDDPWWCLFGLLC